jgi:hypothetical protein
MRKVGSQMNQVRKRESDVSLDRSHTQDLLDELATVAKDVRMLKAKLVSAQQDEYARHPRIPLNPRRRSR